MTALTQEQIAALPGLVAEATPGPWLVETEAEPEEEFPAIYVCSLETQCDATAVATMGAAVRIPQARKVADARLIALAPSLAATVIEQQRIIAALAEDASKAAGLAAALEPFAQVAEHDIGDDEADIEDFRPMQRHHRAPKITVGDMRRARAALDAKP